MVNNHYRWDFIGLSTDEKPTASNSEKVCDGSTFYCSDNSKLYVWYKNQWYEKTASGGGEPYVLPIASSETLGGVKIGNNLTINSETGVLDAQDTTYLPFTGTDGETAGIAGLVPAPATTDAGKFLKADGTWSTAGGGGSGITELTTDDYDYHASGATDNTVALWRLPQGIYKFGDEVSVSPIASTTGRQARGGGYAIISSESSTYYKNILLNSRAGLAYMWRVNASDGSEIASTAQLNDNEIVTQDVIATNRSTTYAEARFIPNLQYIKQSLITSKNGVPTSDDLANAGTICVNYATATPELYVQTNSSSPMNWVKVV